MVWVAGLEGPLVSFSFWVVCVEAPLVLFTFAWWFQFHLIFVGGLVGGVRFSICWFGEAVFDIMFGLVVWRGLFFPFSLGCWFGVWRGRLFHLVWVGSLEGPLF